MPAQSPDELFDVVDEGDRVVGRATRGEVHARGLLHRAVHVLLFNSWGELLLQKRSAHKDEFPLCYTSSASGHLDAGESYEAAARRELQEELGLNAELEFLGKIAASPQTANEHTAVYRTVTDEVPRFPAEEIAGLSFHSLDQIDQMLEREPQAFSPPLVEVLKLYRKVQRDSAGR